MPADYSRIHRLLKILTLIQGEQGWTAERLAQECEVTVRTVYRDMKMLEGAGIPYFHDTENPGYRVRRDFFMPPVQLTLDESLALIALAEHIGGREQVPLTRAAGRAIEKVRSLLPSSLRSQIEQLDNHVAIHLARAGPHDGIQDVYELVRTAIMKRVVLKCRYVSAATNDGRQRKSDFLLHPYTLFFSQRAWYVVGYNTARREIRCLKLNRFTGIKLTADTYKMPTKFRLEDHLGNAWRMIRGDRTYQVELYFDPEFAETIGDTHWHPTQEIDWHDDGSITFKCRVDGLDEIVWWVLSMGPHCVVRRPIELVERVQELAQGVVNAYRSGPRTAVRNPDRMLSAV